jgi:hypothetical protein
VRRSVYEQRLLHWSLGIAFVVGLAAQIGGYLLRSSVTTEPLLLVADLLYALGWSLWTGVVVVLFVQIIPEVKRRQFKQMLDAYKAAQRDEARAGSDHDGPGGPSTRRQQLLIACLNPQPGRWTRGRLRGLGTPTRSSTPLPPTATESTTQDTRRLPTGCRWCTSWSTAPWWGRIHRTTHP